MAKKAKEKTIIDQLRAAVLDSGQTSYRLGKGSGIGQPTIDRFMSGERDLQMATAAKLCEALGLELVKRM